MRHSKDALLGAMGGVSRPKKAKAPVEAFIGMLGRGLNAKPVNAPKAARRS